MAEVNEVLLELFRAHGIASELQGNEIIFPQNGMRASGSIVQVVERSGGPTVQLDVLFEFRAGRTIIESCAGVANTQEAAVADAIRNFAANSFHVLLTAFFRNGDELGDEQALQEEWLIGGHKRRVTLGNLRIRGKPPVDGAQLLDWFKMFEKRLQEKSLGPETHWVRLYYAGNQHQTAACEVLLDNADWDVMQAETAELNWPLGAEFYSVRVFLIIHGVDGEAASPGSAPISSALLSEQTNGEPARRSPWKFWQK